MIGVTGSRHMAGRRRGSSPLLATPEVPARRLSTQIEEDVEHESDKSSPGVTTKDNAKQPPKSPVSSAKSDSPSEDTKSRSSAAQRNSSATTSATTTPASAALRRQSTTTNGTRAQNRLSIIELPTGARLRQRRRAVEITDQRTCVLLHSRLKGMKLEDIALQALSAEVGAGSEPGSGGQSQRRLTALYNQYGSAEADAVAEAARNMSKRRAIQSGQGGVGQPGQANVKGPSSLFIFSDDNFIRKHTRFIIEWPYPFQ